MEEKIKNILNKYKEIENCNNLIFEKENDILSCIKSIGEDGIRMRQKNAAISLLDLKNQKNVFEKELKELCKSFDFKSFKKKKISSSIVAECISEGITSSNLNILKKIFKDL